MQALIDAIDTMDLPTDARRIFHGRGGLYPGCEQWTLDAYPPVFVFTSFAPVAEEALASIGASGWWQATRRPLLSSRSAGALPGGMASWRKLIGSASSGCW